MASQFNRSLKIVHFLANVKAREIVNLTEIEMTIEMAIEMAIKMAIEMANVTIETKMTKDPTHKLLKDSSKRRNQCYSRPQSRKMK